MLHCKIAIFFNIEKQIIIKSKIIFQVGQCTKKLIFLTTKYNKVLIWEYKKLYVVRINEIFTIRKILCSCCEKQSEINNTKQNTLGISIIVPIYL